MSLQKLSFLTQSVKRVGKVRQGYEEKEKQRKRRYLSLISIGSHFFKESPFIIHTQLVSWLRTRVKMSSRPPDTDKVRNRPEISLVCGVKEQHEYTFRTCNLSISLGGRRRFRS